SLLGCQPEDVLAVSAKTGDGTEAVIKAIVERVPAPTGETKKPLRALIFDSQYDEYRGVILYARVVDGSISTNQPLNLMATNAEAIALEVGTLSPAFQKQQHLTTGEIGYVVTNLRGVEQARVGDTLTDSKL